MQPECTSTSHDDLNEDLSKNLANPLATTSSMCEANCSRVVIPGNSALSITCFWKA